MPCGGCQIYCILPVCLSFALIAPGVHLTIVLPDYPSYLVKHKGDITFAFLHTLTTNQNCHKSTENVTTDAHFSLAMSYIHEQISKKYPLPDNLTYGYIVMDDCGTDRALIAQSLSFIPPQCEAKATNVGQPDANANDHSCKGSQIEDPQPVPFHDVAAIICCSARRLTETMSYLMTRLEVPVLAFRSADLDMSDIEQFNYTFFMSPLNSAYYAAIFSIIRHFRWRYVSLVYSSYFNKASKRLKDLFVTSPQTCIAADLPINTEDMQLMKELARELIEFRSQGAQVVVALVNDVSDVTTLMGAIRTIDKTGTFLWLIAAGRHDFASDHDGEELLVGSFLIYPQMNNQLHAYTKWYRQQTVQDVAASGNVWIISQWEKSTGCRLGNAGAVGCDSSRPLSEYPEMPPLDHQDVAYLFDAVQMAAKAAQEVINACEVKSRQCVTGRQLRDKIMNTTFRGYSGTITLGKSGKTRKDVFVMDQIVQDELLGIDHVPLAMLDTLSENLTFIANATWPQNTVLDDLSPERYPRSRCDEECQAHQRKQIGAAPCCWTCHDCKPNQYLNDKHSKCVDCPEFHWPDEKFNACRKIDDTHVGVHEPKGQLLISLAGVFFCIYLVMVAVAVLPRDNRALKEVGRVLSICLLLAAVLAYVAMILIVLEPSSATCQEIYAFFGMSFTAIHSGLLVRIGSSWFSAFSLKLSAKARFLTVMERCWFMAFLQLPEVINLIVTIYFTSKKDWVLRTQASREKEYVEVTCNLPEAGMLFFLVYNMLLLCFSALMAFYIRYSDTQTSQLAMRCGSALFVLVTGFAPAYIYSEARTLKMLLLGIAIGGYSTVAIFLIFFRGIYVFFLGRNLPDSSTETVTVTRTQFMFASTSGSGTWK